MLGESDVGDTHVALLYVDGGSLFIMIANRKLNHYHVSVCVVYPVRGIITNCDWMNKLTVVA